MTNDRKGKKNVSGNRYLQD